MEDDGTQPVPWGTGLGSAPQDLSDDMRFLGDDSKPFRNTNSKSMSS